MHKDYSNREISDTRDTQNKFQYVMTYGDDPLQLTLTPGHPTSNDQWDWENVVSDIHDGVFGDQRTVSIVNGTVSINHVGQTVFDVSLTDGSGVYNTAHHDMEVAVLPKNL